MTRSSAVFAPHVIRRTFVILAIIAVACAPKHEAPPPAQPKPSILLVTLDTTRYDAVGPEQHNADTPSFNSLSARALRFRQAYTPVPQTLAAHSSMMTGLYPGGHGVHENGRYLAADKPLLAEAMHRDGYRTAAFVSAFALARRFGLSRGFDVYDDEMPPDREERTSKETTDRVDAYLAKDAQQPLFLWVHYYDPHFPYVPPEPYRTKYAGRPYYGEVAAMDEQLGRLVHDFESHVKGPYAIIVVGDHGEGLGDHGEPQHGNLMYQSTMHVPLLVIGPGVNAGVTDTPVSTRRIFDTILDFAGSAKSTTLRHPQPEVVAGESMKPFLDYVWQPQVMAIDGRLKAILAGRLEVYDVVADPGETHDLAATAPISRAARATLQEYPVPSPDAAAVTANGDDESRRKLASLGYVASTVRPVVRKDAPRPADMTALFDTLDKASGLFVREQYAACIPLFAKILAADPNNMDAALSLAVAHSALGHEAEAESAFKRAEAIDSTSPDVRTYLALHYAKTRDWQRAVPLLERVVADDPDRLPAVEALAVVRERQGRIADALRLRQTIYTKRTPSSADLDHLGELAMNVGETPVAIDAFERARVAQGAAFRHHLELGVLYLDARRFEDARNELDQVGANDPNYPMALFKRAQVAVLLHETDAPARIAAARAHETPLTRELIARERLFR